MKRIRMLLLRISLLLFLFPLTMRAQQSTTPSLRVEGQGRLDGSAVISNDKRDANGRQVAAIKVLTNLPDLSFESANGVVDLEAQTGEYVVFVSPNERKLTIRAQGFLPLEIILSEVGIRLEPGQLWELTVTGEQQAEKIPVNFVITPDDAGVQLFVDGVQQDRLTNVPISLGQHAVELNKQGFKTIQDTIDVRLDNALFSYRMDRLSTVPVRFEAVPSNAQLVIDGVERGQLPYEDFLFPGSYQVEWRLNGYLTVIRQIEVVEGRENRFSVTLEKTTGTLQWSVNTTKAVVLINNREINESPLELAAGNYAVRVEAEGYDPVEETISILKGQTINRIWQLVEHTGILEFSVSPPEATVKLLQNGTTKSSWKGIYKNENLPVGAYTLEVNADGYRTLERPITIARDSLTRIRIEMQPTRSQQTEPKEKIQTAGADVFSDKSSRLGLNWQLLLRANALLNDNYQANYEAGYGVAFGPVIGMRNGLKFGVQLGASIHQVKSTSVLQNIANAPEQLLFVYGNVHLGYSLGLVEFGLSAQSGQFDGDQLGKQALSSLLAYLQINMTKHIGLNARYSITSDPSGEGYADVGLVVGF